MQPRKETSPSTGSTVFQVTKRGAAVGGASGREDVDVAAVEAAAAESDVEEEDDDEEEDEAVSAARRRRAGFKGAASEGPDAAAEAEAELLALYSAHEDWISSRESGFLLLSSASRASKQRRQCSTVAIAEGACSGETRKMRG
jgi:hypothetical protein